ncbi:uncharacterized protein [Labrus bergylta]|uniref:uncharacterized protein n=1 Tax=Labrus bergylta TaxID=56723 RepID=UPI0033135C82
MHLCELTSADTSAPPPGLIAPLSPRLAEEEEEEEEEEDELGEEEDELGEEEGCLDPENNERFHGYRRLSTRTTEKKCQPRRSDGEKTLPDQSGERRQTRMRHQHCRRRRIQQHEEQEEEKEEEVTGKMKEEEEVTGKKKEEEEGVTPGKIKTDQAERPRRKAVGPPIRYLIEYEEKVHGLSAANHSKDRGAKVDRRRRREEEEEEPGRRGRVERRKKRESSLKESSVGGAKPLLKLHLSRLARSPALRVCRRHHFLNRGSCHGNRAAPADAGCADDRAEEVHAKIKENEEEEKPRLLAHPGAPYLARRRQRVHRNPRWCVDYLMLMSRRRWQENDVRRGRKRRRCREEELKQV